MISIVIPTYNEERYLPRLLRSIKNQTCTDYEVIVSDGKSTDNTLKIAKKFGCRIAAQSAHPGIGRNEGAKIAKGSCILFLDADVVLPHDFIDVAFKHFKKKSFDIATVYSTPVENRLRNKVPWELGNLILQMFKRLKPLGGGWCILVKKELHRKISGFDESVVHSEDVEYLWRARKLGKFGVIRKPKLYVSMRRMAFEGWPTVLRKWLKTFMYKLWHREIRENDPLAKKLGHDLHAIVGFKDGTLYNPKHRKRRKKN